MLVQEGSMLTAGAGRLLLTKAEWRRRKGECSLLVQEKNSDCWYRKGERRLLEQEGCCSAKQNGDAGSENGDCLCRWENADWWYKKEECSLLLQEGC